MTPNAVVSELAQRVRIGMQGAVFAGVGFAAGLVGTAMSNGLLAARKKLDPEFKSQNEAPDVALNAATWAAHMGVSSNLRYQVLNGIDMARPALANVSATDTGVGLATANSCRPPSLHCHMSRAVMPMCDRGI